MEVQTEEQFAFQRGYW